MGDKEQIDATCKFEPHTDGSEDGLESSVVDLSESALPSSIGRYRIERLLGKGGFGLVYLAFDERLARKVAIKVPHSRLINQPNDASNHLTEARLVASLDHPHIVPVYDVGSTPEFPLFVVSKHVEGSDLAARLKQSRFSHVQSAELVAIVAEALHYSHKQGLVHRDVKPGNILIDNQGGVFIVDFGLALRDEDVSESPGYCGTVAYMSPEQAQGEGHRVDGRSDIFSLGVVLYELLAGRRPFKADDQVTVLRLIAQEDPRPLRQYDETIPKELERICFKALSKRASERYATAYDLAEELRHFLSECPRAESLVPISTTSGLGSKETPRASDSHVLTPMSDTTPLRIVPKGLRSFDAHDADFFLELLPGPRDRIGLPDSIRFWKIRIEDTDPASTFSVGLIYGPSGCGKSSLVKAGLIPRLSHDVIVVYVEATPDETETRVLHGLRRRCPDLPENLGLKATLAALRRGQEIPSGRKVLIVLDQFEQWLHVRNEEKDADLVQALRQCDGSRVQCIAMVRDDFWMAATRFMHELDILLLEGQNSAAVDLFDTDHARKVLTAFGRAFGKLSERAGDIRKEQKEFLAQAVAGLAQEGKAVSIRLSLFAEMMKGVPWTPSSLKDMGGTEGVGVAFLEETFSTGTAPPEHRFHQKATRAVLKALLPEVGTDIKGHMRSHRELLEDSGYANRPKDFDDLIRILDSEIRLITPTDPEGEEDTLAAAKVDSKYYQLTHDYLVPSLRTWLTRKQRETRQGRTELRLAEQASLWHSRPQNRHLPALWEWFNIQLLTRKKDWTTYQTKMMRTASRYYFVRLCFVAASVMVLSWAVFEGLGFLNARVMVETLKSADPSQASALISRVNAFRRWADPMLTTMYRESDPQSKQRLYASLALLPEDPTQVNYLSGRLLDARLDESALVRDALRTHKEALDDFLWNIVESPERGKEHQRLRAASALASYYPDAERWDKVIHKVADDLVSVNPLFLGFWSEAFRPISVRLISPLSKIFRDQHVDRTAERALATNLLTDYAAEQPHILAELLMDSDEKQFKTIFPRFVESGGLGLTFLAKEIDLDRLSSELPSSDPIREARAKRQANAAVALLRLNQPKGVWQLLKHSDDPRVRSYLIHRLAPLGVDATVIIEHLGHESDITVRRALVLSLGEYDAQGLSDEARTGLSPKLQEIYESNSDPGLHSAVEWLLRQWGQDQWLTQVNQEWSKDEVRKQRLNAIEASLVTENVSPNWYVNSQGQTLVVIQGPVEFMMGSPDTETGRTAEERQHRQRIGRTFSIATKSVTLSQYREFDKGYGEGFTPGWVRQNDLPVNGIDWSMGARYCNWLSGQEELQACYEINNDKISLKPNYLGLNGYRFPTEAEIEYATRAGAVTSRFFGETEELLSKYAWYQTNSQELMQPVGRLKPNDIGLFDIHGNMWTWCQERYLYEYLHSGEGADDTEDTTLSIIVDDRRALRGGAYVNQASAVRSALRDSDVPSSRITAVGIRLARTISESETPPSRRHPEK